MRYWYDTEFLEDGSTIELISIGIVAEDGREYYAVNSSMDVERIKNDDWLMSNVWPHLPLVNGSLNYKDGCMKPKWWIADEVREFLLADGVPELWADYGAYDHVALAQLWGRMIQLPQGLPMFTREFQQLWRDRGAPYLPEQTDGQHDALADARHLKASFDLLLTIEDAT